MRKGISPIVAVVLLIAIAVIAAVGLYFWVGGLATKQPTPSTPNVITATCTGGRVTITNIGTGIINENLLASTGAVAYNSTTSGTITSGETVVASGTYTGTGTVYGAQTGAATYNC